MIHGIGVGALSGWLGCGLSQYIGGGWGALAGGMISNSIAQLPSVSQGNDFDWRQMLISGGLSCGMYLGASYCNWQFRGGNKMGDLKVSFRQFCRMQALFQRSRAMKCEMGGDLLDDGSFKTAHRGTSTRIDLGTRPEDAIAEFHTHWDEPGKKVYCDPATGKYLETAVNNKNSRIEYVNVLDQVELLTTSRYHGATDFTEGIQSIVLNRYDGSFFSGIKGDSYQIITSPVLRYNYAFLFSIKY